MLRTMLLASAAIGGFAREGPTGAAHRLFLQIIARRVR